VVEAQHRVSTRSLVDSLEEQEILEEIIEEAKPPRPGGPGFEGLHFLLFTPFRYPPLLRGSRFGRADERSLWYGAERVATALAEKSYYQLLFLEGSTARIPTVQCDWTAFNVGIQARRGIDLTVPPFAAHAPSVSSKTSYAASQRLGRAMRAAGVEAFRFLSARCPAGGTNLALFEPVFAERNPRQQQTWRCVASASSCEVFALNSRHAEVLVFPRVGFEVDGRLPAPAL
jgi:RES domain